MLQHGLNIGIQRRCEIGDISVDEKLAWAQSDNLVCRHPAIGTTYPEILRRLGPAQAFKILGIFKLSLFSPSPVIFKKFRQELHTALA